MDKQLAQSINIISTDSGNIIIIQRENHIRLIKCYKKKWEITHAHESALNNAVCHRTVGKDREAREMCRSVEFDRCTLCNVDPEIKQQIYGAYPQKTRMSRYQIHTSVSHWLWVSTSVSLTFSNSTDLTEPTAAGGLAMWGPQNSRAEEHFSSVLVGQRVRRKRRLFSYEATDEWVQAASERFSRFFSALTASRERFQLSTYLTNTTDFLDFCITLRIIYLGQVMMTYKPSARLWNRHWQLITVMVLKDNNS